jgi:hypothetical protein
MTIIATHDWRRLIDETGDNLLAWHEDIENFNWPSSLAQPNWTLLTDGQGSWCLLHPVDQTYSATQHLRLEGHIIIAEHSRGRVGRDIARQMLDWIRAELSPDTIKAKAPEIKTRVFLRWIGFAEIEPGVMELHRATGTPSGGGDGHAAVK